MLSWFLLLLFDEFNRVFIDYGQDLQYKKLNWFWSVKGSYILRYNNKNLNLKVCYKWFLKRGDLL